MGEDLIMCNVCCTAATGVGVSFGVGGPSQMGQHNMNDVGRKPELSKNLTQQAKKVNCSHVDVPELYKSAISV